MRKKVAIENIEVIKCPKCNSTNLCMKNDRLYCNRCRSYIDNTNKESKLKSWMEKLFNIKGGEVQ